jgi:hypothetical protein
MSLYHTLLFSAGMWQQRTTKYDTNSFKYVAAENNKVQYKLIQVCGSREQQSMVQTHSSMWQQRTTKYGTNSFKYVAAENNKVWYKLIQVCGSREQQSTVQTHSSMWQQDYGIHCQVRSEICPHLISLKIIFQIGGERKNVFAVPVNIKLCCLMPE